MKIKWYERCKLAVHSEVGVGIVELGRSRVHRGRVYVHADDWLPSGQDLHTDNLQRTETSDPRCHPSAMCRESSDWSTAQGTLQLSANELVY